MHLFSQQKPLSSANNVYSLDSDWNIRIQKVHLLACHQPLSDAVFPFVPLPLILLLQAAAHLLEQKRTEERATTDKSPAQALD